MRLSELTEIVLGELVPHLDGEYLLTGSSAYGLLLPSLSRRPCKDTDIIIYPTNEEGTVSVDEGVAKYFYITRLFSTKRGFQYGLVHKKTATWVDLFPRKKMPRFVEITFNNNQKVKVHTVEEIVYGLCVATLEKTYYKNSPVLPDSIEKLKRLAPHVNQRILTEIVRENIDQTKYMTGTFGNLINTGSIIRSITEHCPPYNPPGYKFDNYPKNQIIAPNGLSVESPLNYKIAMEQHMKYLEQYKKLQSI